MTAKWNPSWRALITSTEDRYERFKTPCIHAKRREKNGVLYLHSWHVFMSVIQWISHWFSPRKKGREMISSATLNPENRRQTNGPQSGPKSSSRLYFPTQKKKSSCKCKTNHRGIKCWNNTVIDLPRGIFPSDAHGLSNRPRPYQLAMSPTDACQLHTTV